MRKKFYLTFTIFVYYCSTIFGDSNFKVLVTIKPFHSIVSSIMEGISEPILLLQGNESPHNYTLKPSFADYVQDSDIIFWVGAPLETYLAKTIEIYKKSKKVFSFLEMKNLLLLKVPNYKKGKKIKKFLKIDNFKKNINNFFAIDPHIWLDPVNVKIIVNETVKILSKIDTENSIIYRTNGEKYKLVLDELDKELSLSLNSVSSIPFLVFHNAFQYFENRYKLNLVGAFTSNNSFGMSVRRMKEVQKTINEKKIPCIFMEQNMSKKLLYTATEGSNTRIAILDPLGIKINKGPELYSKLLKNISNSLIECLKVD